jgi:hypothetical protein
MLSRLAGRWRELPKLAPEAERWSAEANRAEVDRSGSFAQAGSDGVNFVDGRRPPYFANVLAPPRTERVERQKEDRPGREDHR